MVYDEHSSLRAVKKMLVKELGINALLPILCWTCQKSHSFHHMRNGVKTCRWQGALISGVLVFTSDTLQGVVIIINNL